MRRAPLSLLAALLLAACSSGPRARVQSALDARDLDAARGAYERFRAIDGEDVALMGRVAALLLRAEAESDDAGRRDAALAQLRLGGVAALPTLEALARGQRPVARAAALADVLRLGRAWARPYLAALADSDDPAIHARALAALDPAQDGSSLRVALGDPHPEVREAAARALDHEGLDDATLLALAEVARVDPERGVRVAATRALGAYGPGAIEALRGRLGDPFSSVRLAAVDALLRADIATGVAAVSGLLAAPPSPAGIEAARRLASLPEIDDVNRSGARAYLRAALHTGAANLRSQTAVALASLADASMDASLREALATEQTRGVRLGLARALSRREPELARPVLRELMSGADMPAIQAAGLLAAFGADAAVERLELALAGSDRLLRRVAIRLMAVDAGRPERVLPLLSDPDPLVRIHAAGGILSAANR